MTASDRASLRGMWVLMATAGLDMVGTMIVVPLLPFYATRFGASPSLYGVIYVCYQFAQLTTAPLWGRLSDRYGRRPIILAGLVFSAFGYVAFGLAETLALLFVTRLLQGVGGGITGVVQAYVTDSVPPQERTRALGWLTAATSAGVMVGSALGSLATNFGPHAPGFVAAGLCAANFVSASLWLSEPPAHEESGAPAGVRRSVRGSIFEVLRHPLAPVSSLIWIYAVGMMAFFAMNSILGLYLKDLFGVTEKTIGFFIMYVGGLSVLIRALLLGPLVRRFGEVRVLRLGALTLIVGLLVLPAVTTLPMLALAVVFVPMGTALLFPATTTLVSRLVPRREVGQALGVQQSFGGVSRMVGPLMAGLAYELGPRYPFWIAAVLMGGVSVLTRQVREEPARPAAVPAEAAAVTEAAAPKAL